MTKRKKHVPLRTCVGCRETAAKRELIRVVRSPDGVQIDSTGKLAGRGAYVHRNRECWEKALRGPLTRALRSELTDTERKDLTAYANSLPGELSGQETDLGLS